MAIKIRGQDLQARYINRRSVIKVMRWGMEIRPHASYPTESIVYRMKAWASGGLYVPISTHGGGTGDNYNWRISIDGGPETVYSGTSSTWSDITIGTWYTPDSVHTIVIRPVSETYGWAKAFSCYNVWIANLIVEIVQDLSYKGFAISDSDAWFYFRAYQYCGASITTAPVEILPNTVTTIWSYFRQSQYEGCTSLTTAPTEVLPNTVTALGTSWFRSNQYKGCTSLITPSVEVLPNSITNIWDYFRDGQYNWCVSLATAPNEVLSNLITSIWSWFRREQYSWCTSITTAPAEVIYNSILSVWNDFRASQYSGCTSLVGTITEAYPSSNPIPGGWFRDSQFTWTSITGANIIANNTTGRALQFLVYPGITIEVTISWNIVDQAVDYSSYGGGVAWLTTTNCSQINVPSSMLSAYQSASNWSSVASLFVWY